MDLLVKATCGTVNSRQNQVVRWRDVQHVWNRPRSDFLCVCNGFLLGLEIARSFGLE